jgi:hypothetical protein
VLFAHPPAREKAFLDRLDDTGKIASIELTR